MSIKKTVDDFIHNQVSQAESIVAVKQTISDFIRDQVTQTESVLAANLAYQIKKSIIEYKEEGGENLGAFSVDAKYEDGNFVTRVAFYEDYDMSIIMFEGSDPDGVAQIYKCLPETDSTLCRIAAIMLDEGFIPGTPEHDVPRSIREKQENEYFDSMAELDKMVDDEGDE